MKTCKNPEISKPEKIRIAWVYHIIKPSLSLREVRFAYSEGRVSMFEIIRAIEIYFGNRPRKEIKEIENMQEP